MTVRIGITGPIGCGKSTVASWLDEVGAVVIDADAEARAVVAPGQPAYAAVLAAFGDGVRNADGSLDRAGLARLVFADPLALARLEAIVHPATRERIIKAVTEAEARGAVAVIIEAIKLVQGGLATMCDEVWLVTCAPAIQRDRLIDRGLDPPDAAARIGAQADLEALVSPVATRIIDTGGDIAATRRLADAAYAAALEARGLSSR